MAGKMTERKPGEVFHPSVFIREELDARGWGFRDLASRMSGHPEVNLLALQFYFIGASMEDDIDVLLGDDAARDIARIFRLSPDYYINLEKSWRAK